MKFFHLSVRLTNEKPDAFVCPFDKPIKSLYFRSFVVSVLFARFHFKVIRKSLYSSWFLLAWDQAPQWGKKSNKKNKYRRAKRVGAGDWGGGRAAEPGDICMPLLIGQMSSC